MVLESMPTHVGVSGLSMAAARWSAEPVCPVRRVQTAVQAWGEGLEAGLWAGDLDVAAGGREFPFAVVGGFVRAVGLGGLPSEVRHWCAYASSYFADYAPSTAGSNWPLIPWLTAVGDDRMAAAGDTAVRLLERLLAAPWGWWSTGGEPTAPATSHARMAVAQPREQVLWSVCAALVVDLVLVEAGALRWGRPSSPQHERTAAVMRLLEAFVGLWPAWLEGPGPAVPGGGGRRWRRHLGNRAVELADPVGRLAGDGARRLVQLAMLPATRLHDEQLVIRVRQLELVTALFPEDQAVLHGALAELSRIVAQLQAELAGWPFAVMPAAAFGADEPCRCPGPGHGRAAPGWLELAVAGGSYAGSSVAGRLR